MLDLAVATLPSLLSRLSSRYPCVHRSRQVTFRPQSLSSAVSGFFPCMVVSFSGRTSLPVQLASARIKFSSKMCWEGVRTHEARAHCTASRAERSLIPSQRQHHDHDDEHSGLDTPRRPEYHRGDRDIDILDMAC